ncbi:MAG: DUF167 domain-containing protein [Candidatus Omnitrophota bacterium]
MKLEIRVTTGASREEIVIKEGKTRVYVNAAPDKGKANKAVIALLAEEYGVRKKDVIIVKGKTSRKKLIEIVGR